MKFMADIYSGVYEDHVKFLEDIRSADNSKFHQLMVNLYMLYSCVLSFSSRTLGII